MNGPAQYLHIGFILISLANLIVIALLVVIFVLAVALRRPEKQRVHEAEDRRIHANPEREDDDRRRREPPCFPELPNRKPDVMKHASRMRQREIRIQKSSLATICRSFMTSRRFRGEGIAFPL